MNRRDFLTALASTALAPGLHAAPNRSVGELLRKARADGLFDDAVAGTDRGVVASVGAANGASLFEVASVSKVFTAAIAARLIEKGRLDPARPVVGAATVRDLATHTSGYTDSWMGRLGVYGKTWPFPDDFAYERAVKAVGPAYERGTRCVYSCTNMILHGFVLEETTGLRDLDQLAREHVWKPLGMNATTWRNVPVDDPRLIQIYTHGPRLLGTKGDENARHFTRPLGNAGVFTSADDLARFTADLLSRRTFGPRYYDLMLKLHAGIGRHRRSFGWDMSLGTLPEGVDGVCHSGYTGQYVAVSPSYARAAVVLTNLKTDDSRLRERSFELRRRIAAELIRS